MIKLGEDDDLISQFGAEGVLCRCFGLRTLLCFFLAGRTVGGLVGAGGGNENTK